MHGEKFTTVGKDGLNGHIVELALFMGGRISEYQSYKMRPFLGSDRLDNAVNIEFQTKEAELMFLKMSRFIHAYGKYEYYRGIEFGGSLLNQLGRAEILNSEVDYRLSSAQHSASWSFDGLEELKETIEPETKKGSNR